MEKAGAYVPPLEVFDGNLHTDKGKKAKRTHPRYPDEWYRRIVQEKGESIKIPKEDPKH